ncbi:MAG: hypothetical protein SOU07_00155 [Bacilli bacterium]|nr:hypothetical protein [Acholeplasmataceae bacterium]MDY2901841.1 hypothetical protein [Bacilli bacterium]
MEIKIKCEHEIKLNQFVKLETVNFEVSSYLLKNDTLNGDVKINGTYQKNTSEISTHQGFEDLVPFTVVFRDRNIKINKIIIDEEKISENNDGINCSFTLVVDYALDEQIMEVPVEIEEEIIKVSNTTDEITDDYTKKLEEKMNVRDSINLINDTNVNFNNLKENYASINVYYLQNEKEIEQLAKEKRISITQLLNDNDDFNKTRRLIIDER